MSMDSVIAAQDCRSYLGISSHPVAHVVGYIKGVEHAITVTTDHNKVVFSFEESICQFQYFDTDWQDMEWDEEEKVLTVSNTKPKYSFNIFFPEQ
ncbi:hypothetical protein N7563_06570 [Leclercia adecarboxylata ATCC 23216 = NBRC 102595]|nr:hypothetical protein [Leclercia adecarboxylata ATCC 23216 = NBRC 102595]